MKLSSKKVLCLAHSGGRKPTVEDASVFAQKHIVSEMLEQNPEVLDILFPGNCF